MKGGHTAWIAWPDSAAPLQTQPSAKAAPMPLPGPLHAQFATAVSTPKLVLALARNVLEEADVQTVRKKNARRAPMLGLEKVNALRVALGRIVRVGQMWRRRA